MPDQDDPFSFLGKDTSVRTVLKPMPGGRPGKTQVFMDDAAALQGKKSLADAPSPAPWPLSTGGGLNPVERAASSLIALLGQLLQAKSHPDLEGLRKRVIREIGVFETNARMANVSPENVFVARYVLCTAIDEAVLNTPEGSRSSWGRESLLVTFHKEASGGVRFFQLLKHMMEDPDANVDLLELMYICLALGFQGKYRLDSNGTNRLDGIKDQLYRAIRSKRGDTEPALSPHWQGIRQASRVLTPFVPIWVFGVGLGVLLLLVYGVFSFQLSGDTGQALEKLSMIELTKLPQRTFHLPQKPQKPISPPPEPVVTLSSLLAEDIEAGTITVDEDSYRSLIRVRGDGLFASGKTKVSADYMGLLQRIARALAKVPGQVLVTGHTDNVPIRTLRFPSNWHLSRARAQAVVNMLAEAAGPAERYQFEGRGEREPLVPNDSAANRAINRRVEITLLPHSVQSLQQSD
jgi:type VI secretion system protein ImpK